MSNVRVGITTDGRPVLDLFDLYDREGVPMEIILLHAHTHFTEYQIGWGQFLDRARKAKWNLARKLPGILNLVREEFGAEYADELKRRMDAHLSIPVQ
jgi:hypothetical protein